MTGTMTPYTRSTNQPLTELQQQAVEYFFARLRRTYGPNYKLHYSTSKAEAEAKAEWSRHIGDLQRPQIDAGFKKLREERISDPKAWRWPDIPAIVKLCQPTAQDLGMPNEHQAWHEIQHHCHHPMDYNWSHKAVYLAGHYTGWFDIRNATDKKERAALFYRFREEYQRIIQRVFITGQIDPPEALEDKHTELTEAEKAQRLSEQQRRQQQQAQGIPEKLSHQGFKQQMKALGFLKNKERS